MRAVCTALRIGQIGVERIGRVGINNNKDDKKMCLLLNAGVLGDVFFIDFVYGNIVEQWADRACG